MNEAKEFNEAVEEKTDGVKEVLDSIDDSNDIVTGKQIGRAHV